MTDEEQKKEAERKETEERAAKEKEDAAKNNGNGKPTEEKDSKIDTMTKGNEAMKKVLDEREDLLKRHEELEERERVSGKAEAGRSPPPKKEETDEEFTARVESGNVDLTAQ